MTFSKEICPKVSLPQLRYYLTLPREMEVVARLIILGIYGCILETQTDRNWSLRYPNLWEAYPLLYIERVKQIISMTIPLFPTSPWTSNMGYKLLVFSNMGCSKIVIYMCVYVYIYMYMLMWIVLVEREELGVPWSNRYPDFRVRKAWKWWPFPGSTSHS